MATLPLKPAKTSRDGSVWLQKNGVGTKPTQLHCITMGDISIDNGARELINNLVNGKFQSNGSTKAAPGIISLSAEIALTRETELLEMLSPSSGFDCQFPIYIQLKDCGRADDSDNFVRLLRMNQVDLSTETYAGWVTRDEDTQAMLNVDMEAIPPLNRFSEVFFREQTTFTPVTAANDVWFNDDDECDPNCGKTFKAGDYGVLVTDADTGVPADVWFTFDKGNVWVAGSTNPFGNDENIKAVTSVYIGNGNRRTIVAVDAASVAAGQGQIAYVDHAIGSIPTAAWTTVNIGGATAAHGVSHSKTLFSLAGDKTNLWLATDAGFLYKSEDAGVTWIAKESAAIHSAAYNGIHFIDDMFGIAVGAGDIVALTTDGNNWVAATSPASTSALNSCWQHDQNNLWISTANGRLYKSNDHGETWERTANFTNDGVGTIESMHWIDNFTGYIIHDDATPVGQTRYTINGGYSWKDIDPNVLPVTNAGFNAIWAIRNDLANVAGNVFNSTGFAGRVSLK